jgi:phage baseplate assembly protein W
MTNVAQPLQFDDRGRTAERTSDQHVREMIEAVLFTAPGERVNRPNFGAGVSRLVFEPNSIEIAAATQFLVQGGLQQFLAGIVHVNNVAVMNDENMLRIEVSYVNLRDGTPGTATFERGGLP